MSNEPTVEFIMLRDFVRDMVTLSFDDGEGADERREAFLRERSAVAAEAAMNLLGGFLINIQRIADAFDGNADAFDGRES